MNGPKKGDESVPVNQVKSKPPIPIRQSISKSILPTTCAVRNETERHMTSGYGNEFVEHYPQSDDSETTYAKLSESQLNELEAEGNFTYSNSEDDDEEGDSDHVNNAAKENQPKTPQADQPSNMIPKDDVPHFGISFSNEKLGDDLLLNESANILIDSSGNKSRLEFNEGINSKYLISNTSEHNFTLNSSDASRVNDFQSMIQASIERVRRIGLKPSSDRDGTSTHFTDAKQSENRCISAASVQSNIDFNCDASNKNDEHPCRPAHLQDSFDLTSMESHKQSHVSRMALAERLASGSRQDGLLNLTKNDDERQHLTLSSSIYFKSAGAQDSRDHDDSFDITAKNVSLPFRTEVNFSNGAPQVSGPHEKQFDMSFGTMSAPLDSSNEWKTNFANTDDFLNELKKAEQDNRKEFASNELTIVNESGSDEKWWNMEMYNPQSSKLEVSSFSNNSSSEAMDSSNPCVSGNKKQPPCAQKLDSESPSKKLKSATNETALHTSSSSLNGTGNHHRKAICVDEYFNKKSALPVYLAEKDFDIGAITATPIVKSLPETGTSEAADDSNEMTICEKGEEKEATPDETRQARRPTKVAQARGNDSEITFSTSGEYTSGPEASNNFSFTFNSSETGEFLLKKGQEPPIKSSKPKSQTATSAGPSRKNLDTIGKELASISNRLNNNSSSKSSASKLASADETICSINSFDRDSSKFKVLAAPSTTADQSQIAKNKPAQKLNKMPSNSLTSTPSKLTKPSSSSASNKNVSKISMSDSSSLNIVSGAPQIAKHANRYQQARDADGSSDSNHLFSQESFISSIPERTANDTTITNQNHIRTHHRSKSLKRLKNTDAKEGSESSTSSFEPNRPDQSNDSNESVELDSGIKPTSMNQNIIVSSSNTLTATHSTLPGNTQSNPGTHIAPDMTSNALNNPFTSSMLSNTGSNISNPNSLVPVAFLPMSALLPCFKRMYDDQQQQAQAMFPPNATGISMPNMHQTQSSNNFSALNNMRLSNNDFDVYNRLSVDTNAHSQSASGANQLINPSCFSSGASYAHMHNHMLSQSASMSSLSPRHVAFEPPQVTMNQSELDFGYIAEGCYDSKRLYMNLQSRMPTNAENSFFLVEASRSCEWSAEEVSQEYKNHLSEPVGVSKSSKFKDLKAKLGKAICLSLNRTETDPITSKKSDTSSLKIPLASNFYEFFVHLNLKNVNYFQELLSIQKEQTGSASADKMKPVMIRTELMLYFCVTNSSSYSSAASTSSLMSLSGDHSIKRHLMTKIELRFTLGYVYFKISGSMKEIVFELPDHQNLDSDDDVCQEDQNSLSAQSKTNSGLSCRVEDGDKTLTNIGDVRRASDSSTNSLYVKKNVGEKLVPLTNLGNIDIDLACFFSCDLGKDEEKDKSVYTLNVGCYELKLERSLFTIEFSSSRSIRLLAHIKRMTSNPPLSPSYLTVAQFQRSQIHLIIETRPNGFTFEIPVKIQVLSRATRPNLQRELLTTTRHQTVPKGCSSDSRMPLASKSTNLSMKDKNIRLTASRRILFFAKSIRSRLDKRNELNWTKTSDLSTSVLDEEALPACSFNVQNINQEASQFEMSIVTLLNHGADLSMLRAGKRGLGKNSSLNFFRFHNSMLSSCTSADDSLTKMTFLLEPNQMFKITLEFLVNVANNPAVSSPICHGLIRISNTDVKKMFDISLIGFCRQPAMLDIENVSLVDMRQFLNTYLTEEVYENSLVKHLGSQQSTLLTLIAEMNLLTTAQLADASTRSHRKLVILKNKSISAKCLVYPILFNADLTQPLKSEARVHENSAVNEKWYVINSGATRSTLKILYQMNKIQRAASSEGELIWFELKPEEEHQLNFELISPKELSEAAFNLVIFSIDYDINAYCSLNSKHLKASHSSSSTFLDRLYERFLDLTSFDPMDTNSLKSSRSSLASSFDFSSNQSMFSNLDISQLSTQSTTATREDYLKLIKSTLKCSIIRLATTFGKTFKSPVNDLSTTCQINASNRLPDYLFAANSGDQQNESHLEMSARLDRMKSNQLLQEPNDTRLNFSMDDIRNENANRHHQKVDNEPWTLSTDSIIFDEIQPKTQLTSYAKKFTIRNNSKQAHLHFEILCKSVCLSFFPPKGMLKPHERIQVTVVPTKEIQIIHKSSCSLIVIGNKTRKVIQVELAFAASTDQHAFAKPTSDSIISGNQKQGLMAPAATNATFETTCNDLTQYTIESIRLTPLINASFSLPNTSTLGNGTLNEPHSIKRLDTDSSSVLSTSQKALANASQFSRSYSQQSMTEQSPLVNDESVQIVSAGQDAKIIFPVLCSMQTKTFELSFSNNWNQHVYWRAYAPKKASYLAGELSSLEASIGNECTNPSGTALNQSVFTFSPDSGKMAPSQVERVKIEFSPRGMHGSFVQVWEIETRIGLELLPDTSQPQPGPTLFSCQLQLLGRSTAATVQLEQSVLDGEKKFFSRVDSRLFKSKANQPPTDLQQSSSKPDLFKSKNLVSKENIPQNAVNKTTNASQAELFSSSSLANTSASSKAAKLYTKQNEIIFPDTLPNHSIRSYITISNPETVKFHLGVVKPRDTFYCKIEDTEVSAGHYIKIPVEFRPLATGVYKDKIIFSVKAEGRPPLFCNLIGKCVSTIQN